MSVKLTSEELDCILEALGLGCGLLEQVGENTKAKFMEKLAGRLIAQRRDR